MPRKVRVKSGVKSLSLPDGEVYDGQVDVVLSDAQFAALDPDVIGPYVLDLGESYDPDTPRGELAYAERLTNDTTTNTTIGNAPSNKVSGLLVTVTGNGRPVEIEVYCPAVLHTVANTYVGLALLMDGVQVQLMQQSSPSTANGRSLIGKFRKVLTAGQDYTFEVGKYCGAAGTATYGGGAGLPAYISATER